MSDLDVKKYVSVDPEICHGQPCFKGSRIMVATVLELLEAGQSEKEILEGYPGLTTDHIRAALHLAAQVIGSDRYSILTT